MISWSSYYVINCRTQEFLGFLTGGLFPFTQVAALASSLRTLADMKEPVGEVLKRTEVRRMLFRKQHNVARRNTLELFLKLYLSFARKEQSNSTYKEDIVNLQCRFIHEDSVLSQLK